MFEIPCKNVKICFYFSFFATVSLLMVTNGSNCTSYAFFACLLHEFGHILAMLFFREKISRIMFCGVGIKIVQLRNEVFVNFYVELAILLAGVLMNFSVFAISLAAQNAEFALFGAMNLAIGIFNLLPISALDGGKVLNLVFFKVLSYEKAVKAENLTAIIGIIFICLVGIILVMLNLGNFTLHLTLLYLLITVVFM